MGAAVAVLCAVTGCLRPATPAASPTVRTGSATATAPAPTSATPPAPTSAPADWRPFSLPPGAWTSWKPRLTGVRKAGDGDLARLRTRAASAAGRSFTATVVGFLGASEYAQTGAHARLRIGVGGDTVLEVHGGRAAPAPTELDRLLDRPLTVCLHQESRCIALTGADAPKDRPHLFDTVTDSAVYQAAALMGAQGLAVAALEGYPDEDDVVTGAATMDSPLGPLDCAVFTGTEGDLLALDGVELDTRDAARDQAVVCLDGRGLLVVATSVSLFPVIAYLSLDPREPADLADLPYPVEPYR